MGKAVGKTKISLRNPESDWLWELFNEWTKMKNTPKITLKIRKGLPASLTCQKPHGPKSGKKTYSRKNKTKHDE